MKALTLWEPWASFVAENLKRYETRSWGTSYRGLVLIHAAKRPPVEAEYMPCLQAIARAGKCAPYLGADRLGAIIAVAELVNCCEMSPTLHFPDEQGIAIESRSALEIALGSWQIGRFAWELENVRVLPEAIKCPGRQGLWNPPPEVIEQVMEVIA
ncbi:hypothetical protein [Vacuolonema iberomarrocanum]|uniref:hypothetical protein n=1 Tax=Vacuolonema iberomarrocanum TaxID=3454632 RepID=UPI001A0D948F|nr:ASCH domain-containing protein [filamentous cyanobacterium LEGE 07170]